MKQTTLSSGVEQHSRNWEGGSVLSLWSHGELQGKNKTMCGTFDNNCTALHFGLLTYWSQQAPVLVKCPRWGLPKDHPWWGVTRLPKHTFHKETVYIFLPSNIQQPMCSAECLMGNRAFKDTAKRPCLNVIWSLGELMIHTHTHTQLTPTMLAYKCKVFKCVMKNMTTF